MYLFVGSRLSYYTTIPIQHTVIFSSQFKQLPFEYVYLFHILWLISPSSLPFLFTLMIGFSLPKLEPDQYMVCKPNTRYLFLSNVPIHWPIFISRHMNCKNIYLTFVFWLMYTAWLCSDQLLGVFVLFQICVVIRDELDNINTCNMAEACFFFTL